MRAAVDLLPVLDALLQAMITAWSVRLITGRLLSGWPRVCCMVVGFMLDTGPAMSPYLRHDLGVHYCSILPKQITLITLVQGVCKAVTWWLP